MAPNVRCSVFIATSVDGFIAKPDGDVEWLHRPEYDVPDTDDFGYSEYIATVDAVVMGRKSYEKVLTFPGWAYDGTPVYVLSSRAIDVPNELRSKVTVMEGAPYDVVGRLAAVGKRHLYIDGGATIQSFLQARLIHELTITRIPVLLGQGISLFGTNGPEMQLRLVRTKEFPNGFVQVKYEVVYAE